MKKRIEERTAVISRDFLICVITMQLLVRSDPSLCLTACKKAKEICPLRVGTGSISAELPFFSSGPTVWPWKSSFICHQITPDLYITIKKMCLVQIQTHLSAIKYNRALISNSVPLSWECRIVFCSLVVSAALFTTWGFPSRDSLQVRVPPEKSSF